MSVLDDKLRAWRSATEVSPPPQLVERIVLEAPRAVLAPAPKRAPRWPWLLAAFAGLGGALGLFAWRDGQPAPGPAVAPTEQRRALIEPTRLTTEPISDSFGYGDRVTWVNPDEKRFFFEVSDPDAAVVVIRFLPEEISQAEVDVLVNGKFVSYAPHRASVLDPTADGELVVPRSLVRAGENEVVFDNAFSPPRTAWWRVSNLRLELVPIPERTLLASGRKRLAAAEQLYEQREVPGNMYAAWSTSREARVLLEAVDGERPAEHERALKLEKAADGWLSDTCSRDTVRGTAHEREIGDALAALPGPKHRCFLPAMRRQLERLSERVEYLPPPWWASFLARVQRP